MKRIAVLVIFGLIVLGACGPNNNGPQSPEGKWTYTTADKKMKVDFELIKNSAGSVDIQNPALTVDGVAYNSVAVMTSVALPAIGSIRINSNDSKAGGVVYSILFTNASVSGDFKRIDVPTGEYTLSGGTTSLKTVTIVRP